MTRSRPANRRNRIQASAPLPQSRLDLDRQITPADVRLQIGNPVAGPDNDLRPGHRRYNVVWYRPADERTKLQWLLTDDSGKTHAISIPPHLIRKEAIAASAD